MTQKAEIDREIEMERLKVATLAEENRAKEIEQRSRDSRAQNDLVMALLARQK